LEYRVQISGN